MKTLKAYIAEAKGSIALLDYDSAHDRHLIEEFCKDNGVDCKQVKRKHTPLLEIQFRDALQKATILSHLRKNVTDRFEEQ